MMERIIQLEIVNNRVTIPMLCTVAIALMISCVLGVASYGQQRPQFPPIKVFRTSFDLEPDRDATKEFIVRTKKGSPAYRLTVYSISLNNQSLQSISAELVGIGDSSTRYDTKYEPDLLNPDRWGHGKTEITAKLFVGENGQQVSNHRSLIYKLRHMRIEFTVSNLTLDPSRSGILGGKVRVAITPDPNKKSRPRISPLLSDSKNVG